MYIHNTLYVVCIMQLYNVVTPYRVPKLWHHTNIFLEFLNVFLIFRNNIFIYTWHVSSAQVFCIMYMYMCMYECTYVCLRARLFDFDWLWTWTHYDLGMCNSRFVGCDLLEPFNQGDLCWMKSYFSLHLHAELTATLWDPISSNRNTQDLQ